MKVKEYPPSLYHSAKLWLTPLAHLSSLQPNTARVPVTVSLTSIPSRLPILHLTVRSLLNQSVAPNRIVLWLNTDLENQVPKRLRLLQNALFEIRYADQTCAHRKLVHSLKAFPDETIVTCDDDLLYPAQWLEKLHHEHLAHPADIIANQCRRIQYDENGNVLPYKTWRAEKPGVSHRDTLPIGYGGTLYPVNSLHKDVTNKEQYLTLAPKADDLWFKAMALRQGTATRRSANPSPKPMPIVRSQAVALGHTNIRQDGNRTQWQALVDAYPELKKV